MTSPASSRSASLAIVVSVGSPAGIITHTVRGAASWPTRSSSEDAGLAPVSSAIAWTASARGSQETTSWSESRLIRRTMFAPILPRPMKPICISPDLPERPWRNPAASCGLRPLEGRQDRAGALGDLLAGEAEVLVERLRRRRGTEVLHRDDVALLADPAVPPHRARGLDRDARA